MTPTSLNENSLELTIMSAMTGVAIDDLTSAKPRELPAQYDAEWLPGNAHDYDRDLGIDVSQLLAFLTATQLEVVEGLNLESDGPQRQQFLRRLSNKIGSEGIIKVLRKGFAYNQFSDIRLYYPLPTPGNISAQQLFQANRFSVTRQLHYSTVETNRSLDLVIFVNGLPIFTMELKNTITGQTWQHAVRQYKKDRPTTERLFRFGVCIAHFAVDDQQVHFTTRLAGNQTLFLPFNKGHDDGAGNPPNPSGIRTDYLWKQIFQREMLANILESFVQQIEEKGDSGRKSHKIIFPRYHQLHAVQSLLRHADQHGVGHRYLIQHSAGSGKSNTIAWLSQQLVELGQDGFSTFDSVIVVTDRRVLDTQIGNTMKSMTNSTWMIGKAESSANLREHLESGKRIIITTIQKFPFILDDIGSAHRDRNFAIIIDEAHSSQGGRVSSQMNRALRGKDELEQEEEVSAEDLILAIMEGRKMLSNASYFAFTATPKQKTLELFGTRRQDGRFQPFHTYTMKQAIEEGFILDVLKNYTPIRSYYHIIKTIEDDPEFDTSRARKALRKYVEGNEHTIERKAEIIVDDFYDKRGKLDGKARALVATQSIDAAIKYWRAINTELARRNWPWKTIVAFTGERMVDGVMSSEGTLNGFPSKDIPDKLKESPYRMLIVADKFLTGFDEPLLQTMYIDKMLSDVKAVQAISRLNRSHPGKKETFVLDFANDPDRIVQSFQPFYRTTLLSNETNPNKLHDLKSKLDEADVYSEGEVELFVERFLASAERPVLDAMLDACVERYRVLDEEGQVDFKASAKAFVRSYNFLSQILPWVNAEWERLSIFLTYLTPRLPAPVVDDTDFQEVLAAIDLDSYRTEKQIERDLILEDAEGELEPRNPEDEGRIFEVEKMRLSEILEIFNAMFADEQTAGRVSGVIERLGDDPQLQEYHRNSSPQNARIEFYERLRQEIYGNLGSFTDVALSMQNEQGFEEAFFDTSYRLFAEMMRRNQSGSLSQ